MSYLDLRSGARFAGLGATYVVSNVAGSVGSFVNEELRSLQQELQRLWFLEPGSQKDGADGRWGPRTETGLRNAARYVGYEGTPFATTGARTSTVQMVVPDELIALLHAAAPASHDVPGFVDASVVEPPRTVMATATPYATATPSRGRSWLPIILIGAGVVAVGGAALLLRPELRMKSNRRRRRRR